MSEPAPLVARRLAGPVDPVELFRAWEAAADGVFWLDAGDTAAEGWSIIGIGEPDAAGPGGVRIDTSPVQNAAEPPFRGGWVGWLDYEGGAAAAGAPTAQTEGGAAWLRVQRAIAIDHASGAAWDLSAAGAPSAPGAEYLAVPMAERPAREVQGSAALQVTVASGRHTPDEYAGLIEECRAAIRAGDAYQLCLTTRFQVSGTHDAVQTYLRLRRATPAHHGGFLRIGHRVLLSASPEEFLHISAGRIRTKPIKGTRPRGVGASEDAALAAELHASVKERAENVMIVDLMRNDLSRVCLPGSIRVDGLWEVETYPAVHQLVSTVSGEIAEHVTSTDLWAVAFPAGSMTGAPKLSAMTILHRLEGGRPRGVYSGCFGYVGVDGSMDLAMVIRSIVIDANGAVVGAGGGITWGSDPAAEVAEVATKARAPLAALGAVLPTVWDPC